MADLVIDKYARQKKYYQNHKEKILAHIKNKYDGDEEHRNKKKLKMRQYRKNNLEKEKARVLAWYHANFDKIKEKKYAKDKEWRSKNKDIINFHTNKRYTAKKQRLPVWLTEENLKQIQVMYTLASSLTKTTGIAWHVDHIIPLQGKTVSGLHVPENLQVIPGSLNNKKSNKFEDTDG
jgi:hypothetical protein